MKNSITTYLILASGLAMAALLIIQVSWMRQSQELLEERFDQKVNMALCNTVERLAKDESCRPLPGQCRSASECESQLDTLLETPLFDQTLTKTLAFYDIHLPYRANILSRDTKLAYLPSELPPYSCTLNPLTDSDTHFINLEFEGKAGFILQKMGMMTGASFGILLFICLVFFYATYHLLRQQRMSNSNREFFNHMAHEFRTPLTNIKLAGAMMQRHGIEPKQETYLNIITDESEQLLSQVESVLYLARLEKEDYLLNKEPVQLGNLFGEVLRKMQLRIAEQEADVQFDHPTQEATISGDALHLANAFRNLLDNALKYTGKAARINIDLAEQEEGWQLSIADNGPGLQPQQQERLFDPFYRCQEKGNDNTIGRKGFGLGLAYVKRVVDLHQGRIQVDSHPGAGTRFQILFPY